MKQWRRLMRAAGVLATMVAVAFGGPPASGQDGAGARAFTGELRGHQGPVLMGWFTPDGSQAITVSTDHSARCWSMLDGLQTRLFSGHTGPLFCMAVSGDGRVLATGAQDNTVRLWDVPQTRPWLQWSAHEGRANTLARSPDGSRLVTVGDDNHVRLWDLTVAGQREKDSANDGDAAIEPDERSRALLGHEAAVTAVAFSGDGSRFATGDRGGRILIWNPFLESPQATLNQPSAVTALVFGANSQQLFSADATGRVRNWRLNSDEAAVPEGYSAHDAPIERMQVLNGSQLLSCAEDGTVAITDAESGKAVEAFTTPPGQACCIAVRGDRQRVAVGDGDGQVLVFHAGDYSAPAQTLHVSGKPTSMCFSDDRSKLAVATDQQRLYLFGPPVEKPSDPRQELSEQQVVVGDCVLRDVVFAADHRSVWSVDDSGRLRNWLDASPFSLRQFSHSGPVYAVALSHDGGLLVSASADQTIRVWDAATGQQRAQLRGHTGAVHAVALNPEESLVVSAGADRTLRLWDIVSGKQLKQLAAMQETMYSLAVHPGGKVLAAAGADRQVHLLDLLSGDELRTLAGHDDYIHSVVFDREGKRLLSYSYAGDLRLWNAESGEQQYAQRVGRIGNYAALDPTGRRALLSNGDDIARVIDLPEKE